MRCFLAPWLFLGAREAGLDWCECGEVQVLDEVVRLKLERFELKVEI
jgi:hypothetical protein